MDLKLIWTNVLVGVLLALSFVTSGCVADKHLRTQGEAARMQGSYGYTPLDPLPITMDPSIANPLDVLPDTTMRLAIGEFDADGSITYGPVKLGTAGNDYTVVVDYIQYTTKSIPVKLQIVKNSSGEPTTRVSISTSPVDNADITIVPVYIGVGLRLTANVQVISGSINLANLAVLGASAEAKQIAGTLVIQSLGISGEEIASAIPIPSDINSTTIQNALMAIGTIKAKIYDSKTKITPRVVAVYNPFPGGGPETISAFISTLLTDKALSLGPLPKSTTASLASTQPGIPASHPVPQ
jgi:hypothetical protein